LKYGRIVRTQAEDAFDIDSSIDSSPSDQSRLHQSLLEFINISERHLADTLLHDS